jgi:hypothetical protein
MKTTDGTHTLHPARTLTEQASGNQNKPGSYVTRVITDERGLDFAVLGALFDIHVLELAGLEDLAALFALDELGVFVAAHNLYTQVFERLLRAYVLRRGQLRRHICGMSSRGIG